jgi:hypothetical protein
LESLLDLGREWIVHITGAALFAALGAVSVLLVRRVRDSTSWRYWRERAALRRLLDLPREGRVIFVLPKRTQSSEASSSHRDPVAYEDMLACNLIERALIIAGWREEQLEIFSHARFAADRALKCENLVLICSPKSNDFTAEALELLNKENRLDCTFDNTARPGEWKMTFAGEPIESPSYREAKNIETSGGISDEGPLTDYAILGKFTSPWRADRKVVVVAGIRALGTWAASRLLRHMSVQILEKSHGKDFALVLRSTYEHWKVESYEIYRFREVPPPEAN